MNTKTLALTLALSFSAMAQTPPRMARVYHYEVPPDSAAEFFAVQRETADIYKANKAPHPRLAWTSLTGTPTFTMLVPISGIDKLTERTWLSQQGEEMPRQARTARLRKASGPATIQITTIQEDSTWDPTPDAAPDPFITVMIYSVKPGKVQDFLALMKENSVIAKKMGKAKSRYVSRVIYGGDGYQFQVVSGYDALADISDPATFRTAMGEAAYTAYIQKLGLTLNSVQREIFRYRPEFSYVPSR